MRYPKDSRGLVTLTRNALCAGEQGSLSPAALEAAGMSRRGKEKSPKPKRPKTKLGLPDLDHSKSAILDSLRSPESKRGYRHAIDEFIHGYCSEPRSFNKVVVTRYRVFLENRRLATGTIDGRLAAVRRLAYESADVGLLSDRQRRATFEPCLFPNGSKDHRFLGGLQPEFLGTTWLSRSCRRTIG